MAARARSRAPSARTPDQILRAAAEPDFQQERSRRSYLALIEAAAELFAAHGYDAVGTPEIAQRAGVSVGTFYRYFDDKHEVYLAIARRTMVATYAETIEGLTPERFVGRARHETIEATVSALFEHLEARPALWRSLHEMSLRDPDVAELRRAFDEISRARLAALITAIVPRDVIPDPEATAYVLYCSAMQCAFSLTDPFAPAPVGAARAKQALTAFVERTLFPG